MNRTIMVAMLLIAAVAVPATAAADEHTCNGLEATIVGTDGDDLLIGTPGDDVIVGLAGNDRIRGKEGNDTICSGSGKDIVWDGPGDDWIAVSSRRGAKAIAGSGNDIYAGAPTVSYENARRGVRVDQRNGTAVGMGHDTFGDVIHITGSPFDDVLRGNDWNNTIKGGGGDDLIIGYGGRDDLRGQGGNDDLRGGEDNDQLDPGPGNDVVDGGRGDDTLDLSRQVTPVQISAQSGSPETATMTGLGDDVITRLAGEQVRCPRADTTVDFAFRVVQCSHGDDQISLYVNAYVETGDGDNTVVNGTSDRINAEIWLGGSNTVTLDAGRQVVFAWTNGANRISLGAGDDYVIGGAGPDEILLGGGNDSAFGGPGDDVISGSVGADVIAGWDGDDTLEGGPGTDLLEPGNGDDTLTTDRKDVISHILPTWPDPLPVAVNLAAKRITGAGADTFTRQPFGVIGSPYDDRFVGSGHDTWFDGYDGADRIKARGGNDVVLGGSGKDILFGGSGDDLLDGGPDGDELWGGLGFDSCWVVSPDAYGSCEAVVIGDPPTWNDIVLELWNRLEALYDDATD